MGWVRVAVCGWLMAVAGENGRGQTLPASAPTAQPPAAQSPNAQSPMPPGRPGTPPISAASSRSGQPAQGSPQRARVDYIGRSLRVQANNSSLNQILREISRLTGMKITGGVTDERVFGTYGPDDPAAVLAALLSGTGSNMLLIESVRRTPAELVLTPRQGGPSPPSPNAAAGAGEDDDLPPASTQHVQQAPPPGSVSPSAPASTGAENVSPPESAPSSKITEQSPNGVKTPQQVYEQLMKLRQQQPNPPPPQ